ncbi:hypothetical protein [Streptomyces syringium]|uniref:hypothetical protein n=1 Tax=Streptomyces syringium TaxID=76729 RepID=UPI00342473AC
MDSNIYHVVRTTQFTARFLLGADDRAETVENIDAHITASDGSKWSATFLTPAEISRILTRWADTGEHLNGHYFQCPDLVIVRDKGVPAMVKALEDIFNDGGPRGALGDLN